LIQVKAHFVGGQFKILFHIKLWQ